MFSISYPADEHYRTKSAAGVPQYEAAVQIIAAKRSLVNLYAFNSGTDPIYLAVIDKEGAILAALTGLCLADANGLATYTSITNLDASGIHDGDRVNITGGASAQLRGAFKISVITPTTFQYQTVGGAVGSTSVSAQREPELVVYPVMPLNFLTISQHGGERFEHGIRVEPYTDSALSSAAGNVMFYKADWKAYL